MKVGILAAGAALLTVVACGEPTPRPAGAATAGRDSLPGATLTPTGNAAESPEVPQAVSRYAAQLRNLRLHERSDSGVAGLLARGADARRVLVGPEGVLERLSDSTYERVVGLMEGYLVNRTEQLVVAPDPTFFLDLARAVGDSVDVAFFDAYRRTLPDGLWPTWIEQQTDYSGCTRFGAMALVDGYRRWSGFRRRFGTRYRARADEWLGLIETQLTSATCACGTRDDVVRELASFVDAFPGAAVTPRVQQRLAELRAGRTALRPRCESG